MTKSEKAPERRHKILLVDDSKTVLLMEEALLRVRAQILKAPGGAQALRIAAEEQPDLILLDIVMPDMNGIETCRLLRGMEVTKSTPIIMVSTRSDPKSVESAYAAGATDYVTKPIDFQELRSKIERHLGAYA
jgi:PleD family two-component response regulator